MLRVAEQPGVQNNWRVELVSLSSTMTREAWQGLGQQGHAEDRGNARTGLTVEMRWPVWPRRKGRLWSSRSHLPSLSFQLEALTGAVYTSC